MHLHAMQPARVRQAALLAPRLNSSQQAGRAQRQHSRILGMAAAVEVSGSACEVLKADGLAHLLAGGLA